MPAILTAPGFWIVYAISAAVLWGLSYTMTEQVMKKLSAMSVMFFCSLGGALFALTAGLLLGSFKRDWQIIKTAGLELKLLGACVAVVIVANVFILLSIKAKNATMAGMIEITYPLFTAIFAWVLFKEAQMTTGTLIGFMLIVVGVACIYFLDKTV
ncbi:MAG TPA: DMT family transporter [Alphaproteobacteria bacterium]|jgi:drug/metabolite transporter (DMT)-like permease|nr:DMT family transporter [Alphaproteobacteria bacterium]